MQKLWKIAVSVFVVTGLSGSPLAASQEQSVKAGPVELFACTFREGKNYDDLLKLNEKFAKWASKNDPSYSAWTMTPNFRQNEGDFDIGWIGGWADGGAAMGRGQDKWFSSNGGLGEAYWEVIDCSHSLVSSVPINAPVGAPDNGLVMFASCTLEEGKTAKDSYPAHKKFSAEMVSKGAKGQSWLMYPALGFGDTDFDYYAVTSFRNYEELGEAWDLYTNGGGHEAAEGAMAGLVSCDSPRVYNASLVVGNAKK